MAPCLADEHIRSVILAPIRNVDGVTGFLGMGLPHAPDASNAEAVKLYERMGEDLAKVSEYARLYDMARDLAASEERNRLARELHDSVTQVLFAATLVAEVLPSIWRRDPTLAMDSLDQLRRLTHGALAEMRTLLLELRPSALVRTPLPELLAQLTEAVTSRTRLQFQLSLDQMATLPEEVQVCCYRIAQEALNNVVKHAQARHVEVSLSKMSLKAPFASETDVGLALMIADDGVGFVAEERQSDHMGIAIMEERATAIGADFTLESQPGRGTMVVVTWPKK